MNKQEYYAQVGNIVKRDGDILATWWDGEENKGLSEVLDFMCGGRHERDRLGVITQFGGNYWDFVELHDVDGITDADNADVDDWQELVEYLDYNGARCLWGSRTGEELRDLWEWHRNGEKDGE